MLDEPSIGLHPSNIVGLNGVMHDLIADGNSVVLVDHDTQVLAGLLVDGVVQLAECVAVLGAVDEILKALGEGPGRWASFGQRADLDGVVIDEGGLDELILDKGVEELGQDRALCRDLGQLYMMLLGGSDGILVGFPVVEVNAGILLDGLDHRQAFPVTPYRSACPGR